MSVVKIFDQTIPFVSGYSIRSRYITDSLAQLNVPLKVFSSPIFSYEHGNEKLNGVDYYRAEVEGWDFIKRIPLVKEFAIINAITTKIMRQWGPDIQLIHAHSSVLNGIAASRVACTQKVPFVYEVRALWEDAAVDQGKTKEGGLRYNLTRNLETSIIRKADRVTVICQGLKDDIVKRGIPEDKITIVPNCVDFGLFQPGEKDTGILNKYNLVNTKVIGFIGTFFLFEGLEHLVRAAAILLKKRSDVKFMIVGGGREEGNLKKIVEELGLNDHIIFTGRVKHVDVQKYYSVMDVLVYPRISKRITELVTPLKPLEAMALRKVVIGSNVGGIKELVEDGVNGILFKAGDERDLAEKCVYALDHESEMNAMTDRARAYVERERNWGEVCKRYVQIYKELGVKI